MTIQSAIEKAVAAGWTAKTISHDETCENIATHGDIFLDPKFWQALGKAKGWTITGIEGIEMNEYIEEWQWVWHRLLDHLADGGTIESFFEQL